MNRRNLLLTTARTAILAAFGSLTGARAQTPISSRTVLPIPQARSASPPALDSRNAQAPTIQPLRAPQGGAERRDRPDRRYGLRRIQRLLLS